jgi:hypothetical protein
MSLRSKGDRTAVEPKFALLAIAGLIVLAITVAVLMTSFDRFFRQPAPLAGNHASFQATHEADVWCYG